MNKTAARIGFVPPMISAITPMPDGLPDQGRSDGLARSRSERINDRGGAGPAEALKTLHVGRGRQ